MCPGTIFCFCAELTDVSWYYLFLLCRTCMCPSFCVELVHVFWYYLFLLCRTCTCVLVLSFACLQNLHTSWYYLFLLCRTYICVLVLFSSSLQNLHMCPRTIFRIRILIVPERFYKEICLTVHSRKQYT